MRLGTAAGQSGTRKSYGHQAAEEILPGFQPNTDGQIVVSSGCATPNSINHGTDPLISPRLEAPIATKYDKKINQRKQSSTTSKRVTRSQIRKSKVRAARGQRELDVIFSDEHSHDQSPHKTRSLETSKSVAISAKES